MCTDPDFGALTSIPIKLMRASYRAQCIIRHNSVTWLQLEVPDSQTSDLRSAQPVT